MQQTLNSYSKELERIKRGVKASFVAFEDRKGQHGLKVVKDGYKKFFPLVGHPYSVTSQGYKDLLEVLVDFNFAGEEYSY